LAALCCIESQLHAVLDVDAQWASGPLSAPAIAIVTGSQVAVPSPAGLAGATTPSALTSAPFSSIWTFAAMFKSVGAGAAASAEVPFAESPPGPVGCIRRLRPPTGLLSRLLRHTSKSRRARFLLRRDPGLRLLG
jgi:hypothetical protein